MDVDELKKVLYQLLPPEKIVHAHKILDYAFVHFATREDAEHALATLQGEMVVISFIRFILTYILMTEKCLLA